MSRLMKFAVPVLILAVGAISMFFLLGLKDDAPRHTPEIRAKLVGAEVVKLQSLPTEIGGLGRVTSSQPVELVSEVSGKLKNGDIPFMPGQSFTKGQLLAKIDDRQARLQTNSKKAELLSALAQFLPEIKVAFPNEYPVWEQYFKNCEFNRPLDILPEAANEKIKLYLSRFNIYQLYFAVLNLEIELEKHFFYAPFNGSITLANKREGANIRSGNSVGQIVNLVDLEIEIPVAAEDIEWLDYSAPVFLTSSELIGQWSGEIKRVGSTIDTRTQTIPIFVDIDNEHSHQMREGLFLNAAITGQNVEKAYRVPRRAIYDESTVYLVVNGKLSQRKVSIVRRVADDVIVSGGLNDGDTLVVDMMQGVVAGMPAKAMLSQEG
ncbi:MAG: efflux RND transporter periplasmic adaptor subunit [bacterium]|nr:efflux RND transporter periplasmic adaptor subunit [bacterium]